MLGVKKSMNRLIHMQKTNKSIFTASSRYIPAIISSSSSLPSYIFQQRIHFILLLKKLQSKVNEIFAKNRAVIEPEDGGEDDTC